MFNVSRLFGGGKEKASPGAASDHVYPAHLLDDITGVAESSPCVLMRFNDVLDADKLHDALTTVIKRGDWIKLGGRFRRDQTGKLQFRVPQTFSADQPAVRYVRLSFDVNIDEHPLASRLPKTTSETSLQHSTAKFSAFCTRPGAPGELNDYLKCDEPPIALHVTSFQDATLVAISWSHVLADATGFQEIMTAWCKVLAGREDEIGPLLGAREDPAPGIWENETEKKEEYIWNTTMLTGLGFVWFILRFLWQLVWHPKVEARTLFVPATFIAELRGKAEKELPEGTFVSDGDILCTWLSRLIVSANRHRGPVTLLNVVDLRPRMPSIFKKGGVYIQNLTMPSLTFLNGRNLFSNPSGQTALEIRNSILQQTTEPQIRALYRYAIPPLKTAGRPPVFGSPGMLLVPVSNWTKAKFILTTDFSPAVVRPGYQGADRKNPPGSMVYQITSQVKMGTLVRNTAVIIGKDHKGNYWVTLYLSGAMYGAVEEFMRSSADLN